MKRLLISILGIALAASTLPAITGEEILDRVDDNLVTTTMRYSAHLVISISGDVRTKEFTGYARGEDDAYMEFTSPPRDKGTRFLKLGDEFWMYLPNVGKATKIAGHALRSSLMGSDFSYEDAVSNTELAELYDVALEGEEKIGDDGVDCYVLVLSLKENAEASYATRKIWVDSESFIPVREELYSRSGRLMKTTRILEWRRVSGRNYPTRVRMVNELRTDTWSEFVLTDVQIGVSIPSNVFTKAYLER